MTLLGSAFLLGLFGSLHCVMMCGGITLASAPQVSSASSKRHLTRAPSRALSLWVHAGRILTYALGGSLTGAIGFFVSRWAVRGLLELFTGLALILAGVTLLSFAPRWASVERLGEPLWRLVRPLAKMFASPQTIPKALLFGMTWGFVPCGLVMSALSFSAAAGTPWGGAKIMLAFGSGTVPALLTLGAMAKLVRGLSVHPIWRRGAGALVLMLGLFEVVMAGRHLGNRPRSCCEEASVAGVLR